MKKFFLFGLVMTLVCNLSCVEEQVKVSGGIGPDNGLKEAYRDLSMSLDALNNKYVPGVRGVDWKTSSLVLSTVSMDVTGWRYGRKAGAIIGGFAGGFGGIVPGYYIGGLLGGAASSAIVYLGGKDYVVPNDVYSTVVSLGVQDGMLNSAELDSIGYYHNLMVYRIYAERDKYLHQGLPVDYAKVIGDVNEMCNSFGLCDEYLTPGETQNMVDFNVELDSVNQLYLSEKIGEDSLFAASAEVLGTYVRLDENDYYGMSLLDSKIIPVCAAMYPSQVPHYFKDFKDIVNGSHLPNVIKSDLIVTGMFVANSAQCASVKVPLP